MELLELIQWKHRFCFKVPACPPGPASPLSSILNLENKHLPPPTFEVAPSRFYLDVCQSPFHSGLFQLITNLFTIQKLKRIYQSRLIKEACPMFNMSPRSFPCIRLIPPQGLIQEVPWYWYSMNESVDHRRLNVEIKIVFLVIPLSVWRVVNN